MIPTDTPPKKPSQPQAVRAAWQGVPDLQTTAILGCLYHRLTRPRTSPLNPIFMIGGAPKAHDVLPYLFDFHDRQKRKLPGPGRLEPPRLCTMCTN